MPAALILAAALAASPAPPPKITLASPPVSTCGAQLDPKFVTFVPPAEARGGDPFFRLVGAPRRDTQYRGGLTDTLGCLTPAQRVRTAPRP